MFLETGQACEMIAANPAPLVYLDTCKYLDVLRAPYAKGTDAREIAAAIELIRGSKATSPKVWIVANETVYEEWHRNIDQVATELESNLARMESERDKCRRAADALFGTRSLPDQAISAMDLSRHLQQLSSELLKLSLLLAVDDSHQLHAMKRVLKTISPASKGKREPEDCLIFECFLDLAARLRGRGYLERLCFVTSNSKDYGKPGDSPVSKELAPLCADYVSTLDWALAIGLVLFCC